MDHELEENPLTTQRAEQQQQHHKYLNTNLCLEKMTKHNTRLIKAYPHVWRQWSTTYVNWQHLPRSYPGYPRE